MYLEVVYTTTGTGFVRESGPSAAFDTPNGCKRGNEGPTVHDLLKIAASSGGKRQKALPCCKKPTECERQPKHMTTTLQFYKKQTQSALADGVRA
jgi:hypothetical protein